MNSNVPTATIHLTPAPQLRLTFTPDLSGAPGIWTDFQTTSIGDLYIHPFNATVDANVGINTSTPGNRLEINGLNPNGVPPADIPGASGLRFNDMTWNSIPITNPFLSTLGSPCVLSVDGNGDVVLVDDWGTGSVAANNGTSLSGSTVQLGHVIPGGTGANLLNDRQIPMDDHNLVFTDPGTTVLDGTKNAIGIGTSTPVAKLEIYRGESVTPLTFANAVKITNEDINDGSAVVHGILTYVTGANVDNSGGVFVVNGAENNIAVGGTCIGTFSSPVNTLHIGGQFISKNGDTNFGVDCATYGGSICYGGRFEAINASTNNYGIYSTASGTGATNWAGFFVGNVYSTTNSYTSDSILKTNINPLTNASLIISQLLPKTYSFKKAQYPQMHLPDSTHAGLIAQDVQQILPGLVSIATQPAVYDSTGNLVDSAITFKALNYVELIPYLIGAVQDLQTRLDSLINSINAPKPAGNTTGGTQQKTSAIEVELNNQSKIVLNQNDPNPFAENTTINYFIPDNVAKVQMMFYDNSGTILKTVDIKEKGAGSILVYGSNLSSGSYSYTLIADGKMISKKMMKIK